MSSRKAPQATFNVVASGLRRLRMDMRHIPTPDGGVVNRRRRRPEAMMRIAHIADSHLGYRSATIPQRSEDFATAWITACRDIVAAKPDFIIHAGDVFHRPNPSWASVIDFLDGAALLKEANVPIFMISGNHDSSRLRLTHTVFSVLAEAVPFISISYSTEPQVHQMPEATVVLLSHQALLSRTLAEDLISAIRTLGWTTPTILVAHGDVYDLDKAKEQGSIVIPNFVLDYPWSYIALGHLHVAQPFGPTGWYSGSIERCGWSDVSVSPAWTLVTLTPSGVRHEQRSLPAMTMIQLPDLDCRDEDIDIPAEVLKSLSHLKMPEGRSAVRIKLNGVHPYLRRSVQFTLKRMIRQIYPTVVFQVEIDSVWTNWGNPPEAPEGEIQSVEDMFRDFVDTRIFEDPEIPEKLLEVGLAAIGKVKAQELDSESL